MLYLISYDIEDDKVRTRLAKRLKKFGPRVQKSVFEADLNKKDELENLKQMLGEVKLADCDSIRLYRLCADCTQAAQIWGIGQITEDKEYYIV